MPLGSSGTTCQAAAKAPPATAARTPRAHSHSIRLPLPPRALAAPPYLGREGDAVRPALLLGVAADGPQAEGDALLRQELAPCTRPHAPLSCRAPDPGRISPRTVHADAHGPRRGRRDSWRRVRAQRRRQQQQQRQQQRRRRHAGADGLSRLREQSQRWRRRGPLVRAGATARAGHLRSRRMAKMCSRCCERRCKGRGRCQAS
eukprot:scaffold834_cov311-Prasinococcus_capsulatus_cf.AAC.4